MNDINNQKRLFVIGPMHVSDQHGVLSSNTLELVNMLKDMFDDSSETESIIIEAPEALVGGSDIPEEVFGRIDIADIIVADLTPRNADQLDPSANVMYELALADTLGLPTFLVRNSAAFGEKKLPAKPFYFRNKQVHSFDFNEKGSLNRTIGETLRQLARDDGSLNVNPFINPFTRFYSAPVINISAAVGLAVSYFYNFVNTVAGRKGSLEVDPINWTAR